jgi:hypothetical protein
MNEDTKNTNYGSRIHYVDIFDALSTMVERVMTDGRETAHGGEQNIWFGKFKLPAVV